MLADLSQDLRDAGRGRVANNLLHPPAVRWEEDASQGGAFSSSAPRQEVEEELMEDYESFEETAENSFATSTDQIMTGNLVDLSSDDDESTTVHNEAPNSTAKHSQAGKKSQPQEAPVESNPFSSDSDSAMDPVGEFQVIASSSSAPESVSPEGDPDFAPEVATVVSKPSTSKAKRGRGERRAKARANKAIAESTQNQEDDSDESLVKRRSRRKRQQS